MARDFFLGEAQLDFLSLGRVWERRGERRGGMARAVGSRCFAPGSRVGKRGASEERSGTEGSEGAAASAR